MMEAMGWSVHMLGRAASKQTTSGTGVANSRQRRLTTLVMLMAMTGIVVATSGCSTLSTPTAQNITAASSGTRQYHQTIDLSGRL